MSDTNPLTIIVSVLQKLDSDEQARTLQAVATYLGISLGGGSSSVVGHHHTSVATQKVASVSFSEDRSLSAKDFIRDKAPKTDHERVACLAYYLTHYKDTPHFKTIDISTLNMEAAQPKFSNTTYAVNNAAKAGYLAPSMKGSKQLSAAGEIYVKNLPDRDAAKAAMTSTRPRRKNKKAKKSIKG